MFDPKKPTHIDNRNDETFGDFNEEEEFLGDSKWSSESQFNNPIEMMKRKLGRSTSQKGSKTPKKKREERMTQEKKKEKQTPQYSSNYSFLDNYKFMEKQEGKKPTNKSRSRTKKSKKGFSHEPYSKKQQSQRSNFSTNETETNNDSYGSFESFKKMLLNGGGMMSPNTVSRNQSWNNATTTVSDDDDDGFSALNKRFNLGSPSKKIEIPKSNDPTYRRDVLGRKIDSLDNSSHLLINTKRNEIKNKNTPFSDVSISWSGNKKPGMIHNKPPLSKMPVSAKEDNVDKHVNGLISNEVSNEVSRLFESEWKGRSNKGETMGWKTDFLREKEENRKKGIIFAKEIEKQITEISLDSDNKSKKNQKTSDNKKRVVKKKKSGEYKLKLSNTISISNSGGWKVKKKKEKKKSRKREEPKKEDRDNISEFSDKSSVKDEEEEDGEYVKKKNPLYNTYMKYLKQDYCYSTIVNGMFHDTKYMQARSISRISRNQMKELIVENPLLDDYYFTKVMAKREKKPPFQYEGKCLGAIQKIQESEQEEKKHFGERLFGKVYSGTHFSPRRVLEYVDGLVDKPSYTDVSLKVNVICENVLSNCLLLQEFRSTNKLNGGVVSKIDWKQYEEVSRNTIKLLSSVPLEQILKNEKKGKYTISTALRSLPLDYAVVLCSLLRKVKSQSKVKQFYKIMEYLELQHKPIF